MLLLLGFLFFWLIRVRFTGSRLVSRNQGAKKIPVDVSLKLPRACRQRWFLRLDAQNIGSRCDLWLEFYDGQRLEWSRIARAITGIPDDQPDRWQGTR